MRAVYHSLLHLINHINKLIYCSHLSDEKLLELLDEKNVVFQINF